MNTLKIFSKGVELIPTSASWYLTDLGEALGVGAHMLELRRTDAGIFSEGDSVDLYEFEKAVEEYKKGNDKLLREMIVPAEIVSELYDAVEIKKDNLAKIFTGKPIHQDDLVKDVTPLPKGMTSKKVGLGVPQSTELGGNKKQGDGVSVFCEGKFVGMYQVIAGEHVWAKSLFVLQAID